MPVARMSREQIAAMFPNASRSLLEANAGPVAALSAAPPVLSSPNKLKRARQPNKTEARFGRILEARKERSEIRCYSFEAITLHWGDGMKYTPDWLVFLIDGPITCIEVKGGYKWQKDVIRYKGCSAQWRAQLPDVFAFELHEEKNGIWQRID